MDWESEELVIWKIYELLQIKLEELSANIDEIWIEVGELRLDLASYDISHHEIPLKISTFISYISSEISKLSKLKTKRERQFNTVKLACSESL